MKNNKGITLIALVVTIIVLLILAGVTITMLTGDTGLMARSEKTVYMSRLSDEAEKINYYVTEAISKEYTKVFSDETTSTEIGTEGTKPDIQQAIADGIKNAYAVKDPLVEWKTMESKDLEEGKNPAATGATVSEYETSMAKTVIVDPSADPAPAKAIQIIVAYNGHYKTGIVRTTGIRWFEVDKYKVGE